MEIFFIIVFIASSIGFLLTPGGALGMLAVQYNKNNKDDIILV